MSLFPSLASGDTFRKIPRGDIPAAILDFNPAAANSFYHKELQATRQFTRTSTQHYKTAQNTDLTGDIDLYVAGWVKIDDTTNSKTIVGKYDFSANKRCWWLTVNSASLILTVSPIGGSGSTATVTFPTAMTTTPWYFVEMWHLAGSDQIGVCVNRGTDATASYSSGLSAPSVELVFGAYSLSGGTNNAFNGQMSRFGIWTAMPATAERDELYHSGNGLEYEELSESLLADLWAFYPFETDGTDAHASNDLTASTSAPTNGAGRTLYALNGDTVEKYLDAIDTDNYGEQATLASQPKFYTSQINSLPVIRVDGEDDYFDITTSFAGLFRNRAGVTIFVVKKAGVPPVGTATDKGTDIYASRNSSTGNWRVYAYNIRPGQAGFQARRTNTDSNIGKAEGGTINPEAFQVVAYVIDWANNIGKVYIDGHLVATDDPLITSSSGNSSDTDSLLVRLFASDTGSYALGDYARILVHDSAFAAHQVYQQTLNLRKTYGLSSVTTDPLATMDFTTHPRLHNFDSDAIASAISGQQALSDHYDDIVTYADTLTAKTGDEYDVALSSYTLSGGSPSKLDEDREIPDRLYNLAFLYRYTEDEDYAERCRQEMLAIAAFTDWNHVNHAIDTGDIMRSMSFAYDWLYNYLSDHDRQTIRGAIVNKGILAVQLAEAQSFVDWDAVLTNWNQVISSGLGIAALAVAEDEPAIASAALKRTFVSLSLPLSEYAPDGGWVEGPQYWSYGGRPMIEFFSALDSALGTTFGLEEATGFDNTGNYRLHYITPRYHQFNIADSSHYGGVAPQMFWLATKFDEPYWQTTELQFLAASGTGKNPFYLLWYDSSLGAGTQPDLHAIFTDVGQVMIRSAWEDEDASYLGVKGGRHNTAHGHYESGTWIFERYGFQWINERGYGITETVNQNTIAFCATGETLEDQEYASISPITFDSVGLEVDIDLAETYPTLLSAWDRNFVFGGSKTTVTVEDVFTAAVNVDLRYTLHTKASATVSGNEVTLSDGTNTYTLTATSHPSVTWTKTATTDSSGEACSRLHFDLANQSGTVTITVTLA